MVPNAGLNLADMGAEVIKIERTPKGDEKHGTFKVLVLDFLLTLTETKRVFASISSLTKAGKLFIN